MAIDSPLVLRPERWSVLRVFAHEETGPRAEQVGEVVSAALAEVGLCGTITVETAETFASGPRAGRPTPGTIVR